LDYDLLNVIHPKITIQKDLKLLVDTAKKVTDWHDLLFIEVSYERWAVHFMALIRHCDRKSTREICEHLTVAPRHATLFCDARFEAERKLALLERKGPMTHADVYNVLTTVKTELILYMMICTPSRIAKKRISNYHTRLRNVRTTVSGKDLLSMGLSPGPIFGEILQAVVDAKLNGEVKTREDELSFVKRMVRHLEKEQRSF
jgi:tRNA nucleotidyltransferase (CCA-adding enzyme)